MMSSSGSDCAISSAFFAGIRKVFCVLLVVKGIFFSASRNESVATIVNVPASIEKKRLASSGRTVEMDAHPAIDVRIGCSVVLGSTSRFFGFSGNGMLGKSSYGVVLSDNFPVPLVNNKRSPVCSSVLVPPIKN